MAYKLRTYQQNFVDKILSAFSQGKKMICATAPTGAGKTIMGFKLIESLINQGKRVLFVVNREELVLQTVDKFHDIRHEISIIKAGYETMFNPKKKIQVTMIQTWHSRKIGELDPDFIFIDEVHEGINGSRIQELFGMYPDAKVLGLTATPIDEKGYLIPGFDMYIQDIQVAELIEQGFLVKPIVKAPHTLDLSNVRTTGNDYNEKDLDEILTQVSEIENIVKQYREHANGLRTLVFANTIDHAEKLKGEFVKQGYKAEVIHSKLDNLKAERGRILREFKAGTISVLINVGILTTGFDEPKVQCVLLARPTKILRLYIQIAGRGLRICEGKTECLFLDCANIAVTHGYPDEIRVFDFKHPKKDEIRLEFKKCPKCEQMVRINVSECPYCGYKFTAEDEKPVTKAEAEKLTKLRNLQNEGLELLREVVVTRGYKKGYAFFLMKNIATIKPPNRSAFQYYGKVLTMIEKLESGKKTLKTCPDCGYLEMSKYKPFFQDCPKCGFFERFKPQWMIYKLKNHYGYRGKLEGETV